MILESSPEILIFMIKIITFYIFYEKIVVFLPHKFAFFVLKRLILRFK